eukprot:NODE_727_length_4761_cov_0.252038.p2 type:complete len:458 gc:universal NODE_727_length_4761_cov_0.252038:1699-326(-)
MSDESIAAQYQLVIQNKDTEIAAKDDLITKLNLKVGKITKEMYHLKKKYRNSLANHSECTPSPMKFLADSDNAELQKLQKSNLLLYSDNKQLQSRNSLLMNAIVAIDSHICPNEMDRSDISAMLCRIENYILHKSREIKILTETNEKLMESSNVSINSRIKSELAPFFSKYSRTIQENNDLTNENAKANKRLNLYKNSIKLLENTLSGLKSDSDAVNTLKVENSSLRETLINSKFQIDCSHVEQPIDLTFLNNAYQTISSLELKSLYFESQIKFLKSNIELNESLYRKYHVSEPEDLIYSFIGSPAIKNFVASQQDFRQLLVSHASLIQQVLESDVEQVPMNTFKQLQLQLQKQNDEMLKSNKMMDRMKMAFAKKAYQVQQITLNILGWHLDLMENDRFKLSSENGRYFIFSGTLDKLSLVGMNTDDCIELEPLMQEWLTNKKCIAKFLANVLLLNK